MQLNKFTDLGIRVLLLLSAEPEKTRTISQLADVLQVSKNHLMKVVHFLSIQKWLITIRGKNGGIKLARSLKEYPLGATIQALESHTNKGARMINCQSPQCVLLPSCLLGDVLEDSLKRFYTDLDRYTLFDIVSKPISQTINIPVSSLFS